jgi:hypothetical protein
VVQVSTICNDTSPECQPGPFLDALPAVTDNNDGTYTVAATIIQPGLYRLTLTMLGQNVSGSPFDLRVTQGSTPRLWFLRVRACC